MNVGLGISWKIKELSNITFMGRVDNFFRTFETLEPMKKYTEGRIYCVQIGNAKSRTQTLSRVVPQGSVLDPILFCT